MNKVSPLSAEEKKWQQNFERKLDQVGGGSSISTPFLDPRQLDLAESVLKQRPNLSYTVYGGYPGAERNAICIFPSQHKSALPAVTAVKITWPGKTDELSHRDLLGAVLALGFRRDQVGDIVIFEDSCAAIMVDTAKADYICTNLLQVGCLNVNCNIAEPDQLPLARDDGRDIKGTVASLRVDAVLSLGFGISRSRVVLLVRGGVVRVNWRPINSPSVQLKEGDQVSLKGRGRISVASVEGETRKGRIRLKLKKYS